MSKAWFSAMIALALHVSAQNQRPPLRSETGSPSAVGTRNLPTREEYVGDQVCGTCHQEKASSFHETAHYLTSRLPDKASVLGPFTATDNVLTTSNPDLLFRMEETKDGFFQTAVQGAAPGCA